MTARPAPAHRESRGLIVVPTSGMSGVEEIPVPLFDVAARRVGCYRCPTKRKAPRIVRCEGRVSKFVAEFNSHDARAHRCIRHDVLIRIREQAGMSVEEIFGVKLRVPGIL